MDVTPPPAAANRSKATAIAGDGIGPEVMRAVREVLAAAGAAVDWEDAVAGAEAVRRGVPPARRRKRSSASHEPAWC